MQSHQGSVHQQRPFSLQRRAPPAGGGDALHQCVQAAAVPLLQHQEVTDPCLRRPQRGPVQPLRPLRRRHPEGGEPRRAQRRLLQEWTQPLGHHLYSLPDEAPEPDADGRLTGAETLGANHSYCGENND